MASRPTSKEYKVKLGDPQQKKVNVMRFKPPHRCDLEKLTDPTLQRQETQEQELDEAEAKRREEWRKKRKYRPRKPNPEDQPWVLREKKKDGAIFYGRKEGGINTSASYYIMRIEGGDFEAIPINNWYDFVPPVKYNYLNDEEAEERFDKRNKTLNYFSIMVSKRIRESEGVAEEEEKGKGKGKGKGGGGASVGFGTVDSDSDDGFSSSGSGEEGGSSQKKRKKGKGQGSKRGSKKKEKKKNPVSVDGEAGEESDEGDFESKEMDYSSSSSSEGDDERIKAVREEPRDDAEVERKEEREIDKVFEESSSEGEDKELTESGKQLKELIYRHDEESDNEGEEPMEEEVKSSQEEPAVKDASLKRDMPTSSATGSTPPPSKKQKLESPSTILPEEVKKYLTRKPMTSKALVKKFVKLKTELDKGRVVNLLGTILKSMPQIDKQKIKGKIYLSVRPKDVT